MRHSTASREHAELITPLPPMNKALIPDTPRAARPISQQGPPPRAI
jgi:hypothetical protein